MTISAQTVILDAHVVLQDLTGTRWPASELVRYLNDAQRAVVAKRPEVKATLEAYTCVAGEVQSLPSTAQSLIDVHSNALNRPVTKVDRLVLEATDRNWMAATPGNPVHFMHTLTDPRKFYVYPPAKAETTLNCVFSNYPTDVGAPTAPGKLASTVTGNADLPDEYEAALLHFVLFRAYSKDAEFGGNAQLAGQHYQLFKSELGEQAQGSATVSPKE